VLLDTPKLAAAVPVTATDSAEVALPPELVIVKVAELPVSPMIEFPKAKLKGLITRAPGTTPVPVKLALAVPPGVAEAVSVALREPWACGVNRTVTAQVAAGPIDMPQVEDNTVKSAEVPVENVGAPVDASPLFVTPKVAVACAPPVGTLPKSSDVGVSTRWAGARPVPPRFTTAGSTPFPLTDRVPAREPAACG
jgi:hypothetical protein